MSNEKLEKEEDSHVTSIKKNVKTLVDILKDYVETAKNGTQKARLRDAFIALREIVAALPKEPRSTHECKGTQQVQPDPFPEEPVEKELDIFIKKLEISIGKD